MSATPNKLRVLHVSSPIDPNCGGTATAVEGMTVAQHEAGLDVRIFATRTRKFPDLSLADKLRGKGMQVRVVGMCRTPLMLHRDIRPTAEEMIAQADVVHIHGLWEQSLHVAARVAYRRGVPYVITPHGMLDPWGLGQHRWRKQIALAWRVRKNLNRASAMNYTAEIERDTARPLGLRPPPLIEPCCVDLDDFKDLPPAGAFRRKFPQLQNRPMALFLSRIHLKKGLDHLVPAFAAVQPAQAMLVIGGVQSDYINDVRQMVQDHHLEDRVILAGRLSNEDRKAAMVDTDVFVLSSYQENFGIAVVEALAAGAPVIISDQVNIHREVTAAGVGGVVPLDIPKIAAEISRWLQDAALRQAAKAKTQAFAWNYYDRHVIGRRWVEHYRRLAEQAARSRAPES